MDVLCKRENPDSWNILECLEHLNLYGRFYLPQIEAKIRNSGTRPDPEFRSGLLGNYFAKSMLPKQKLNKMKTFKDKNPLNTSLNKSVIDQFLKQQFQLLELINQAANVSLNQIKIPVSFSRFIQLKLGDTFQFLVNHNLRHLQQIERIEKAIKSHEALSI